MTARSLAPLFDRIVAAALPLAVTATTGSNAGCCPPYVVDEVRTVRALPEGWSWGPGQAYLQNQDDIYAASEASPSIDDADCALLCGGTVQSCTLVPACTPLTTVNRNSEPPEILPEGEGGGGGAGGGSAQTGPCATGAEVTGPLRVSCEVTYGATCGRRPQGLRGRRSRGAATLGAFLTECHRLEAVSVVAFDVLGRELAHHGAPRALVLDAASAMHDERRHASAMAGLARKHGARPRALRSPSARAPRPLLALAIENAREGCVRETYGALLAHWQAARAQRPDVRTTFGAIARDEARHAELAHAVHAWAMTQLAPAERTRVHAARRRALVALARELETPPPPALSRDAGLPPPRVARFLLRELTAALG